MKPLKVITENQITDITAHNVIVGETMSGGVVRDNYYWTSTPTTKDEVSMGYTGGEVVALMMVAFGVAMLLGLFLGRWSGKRFVRDEAIAHDLGKYGLDPMDGKIEFWWTGKPGKK